MKAGKYWVGDLCYVLADKWDEVCELTIKDNQCLYGEFTLKDGTKFAIHGTAWGDGEFGDNEARFYPVDSGSIGCVLVDSIDPREDCGHVIDFEEDFETGTKGGTIFFGEIEIETDSVFISHDEW
jgi:hypothetical protein